MDSVIWSSPARPSSRGCRGEGRAAPGGSPAGAAARPPATGSGHFLFLQGVNSPFFHRLGMALGQRGHLVERVNFTGGDRLFWPSGGAHDFCGAAAEWPGFLDRLLRQGVSDVVLHGDCRPLHRAAVTVAARHGVRVRVFEEGYLRPDWVTLELGGVNGHSALPRDPAWFRQAAQGLPEPPPAMPGASQAGIRAGFDIAYAAAELALAPRYRHYRTHRPWSAWREGWGWAGRLLGRRAAYRRSAERQAGLLRTADATPFFVLPLQLDSDCQITAHSPFPGIAAMLDHVLASFARAAPAAVRLVVKAHPLHNGLRDWAAYTAEAARLYGVADRVVFLEEGLLEPLLARACGMVTVNSTAGSLALSMGVPVLALGRAVYGLPGLTTPAGALDHFWAAPRPPDAALFDAFLRVLAASCLVRGDFYTPDGIRRAVAGSVPRLELATAPLLPCQERGT